MRARVVDHLTGNLFNHQYPFTSTPPLRPVQHIQENPENGYTPIDKDNGPIYKSKIQAAHRSVFVQDGFSERINHRRLTDFIDDLTPLFEKNKIIASFGRVSDGRKRVTDIRGAREAVLYACECLMMAHLDRFMYWEQNRKLLRISEGEVKSERKRSVYYMSCFNTLLNIFRTIPVQSHPENIDEMIAALEGVKTIPEKLLHAARAVDLETEMEIPLNRGCNYLALGVWIARKSAESAPSQYAFQD